MSSFEMTRRVIMNNITTNLTVEHSAVQEMIHSLGYQKVCIHLVLHLLT